MSNREIFNRYPFDMEIPDQPYIDNFSKGLTHPAIYTGVRFLKFRIENGTGLLKEEVANGHTLEEMNSVIVYPEENHEIHIIDAKLNPWEAAYLTNAYSHDPVPVYEEDLGTVDSEGNPEIWDYNWGHVLNQIYYSHELRYVNGEYVKPPFRLHQHTQEVFIKSLHDHQEMVERELSRPEGVYTVDQKANLQKYKEDLDVIETKYVGIHHWKIPFPALPLIRP